MVSIKELNSIEDCPACVIFNIAICIGYIKHAARSIFPLSTISPYISLIVEQECLRILKELNQAMNHLMLCPPGL